MELFEPGNQPMMRLYPELANNHIFRRITEKERQFVWHYACKASPYYGYEKEKRVLKIFTDIPEYANGLEVKDYEGFIDCNFPSHLSEAIKEMERFEPEVRRMAKVFTDRILEHMNKATSMDMGIFCKAGAIKDMKEFMEMQINIGKNLPSIVEAAEHGYGYKKAVKDEKKKSGTVFEEED